MSVRAPIPPTPHWTIIMKRFTPLACWLLLGLCPPLLGQCGGAAQPGTLDPGTETGNPPRVDGRKLFLVQSGESVLLIGEAGAVSPGGASVRVTNLRTGVQVETTALNDGSINVVIPGSLADGYELSVSNEGQAVNLPVPASDGSSLDALSCNALENALGQRIASGFAAADTSCTTHTDCVLSGWGVGCYYQCGSSYLSLAGQSASLAAIEAATEPVCTELDSRCERQPASSCPPSLATVPECRDGTCQGLDVNALECQEVSSRASLRVNELLERADRACATDDDCALVNPSVSCFADCGRETNISVSAVQALTESVAQIERDFCQSFDGRQCPPPLIPPCTPPQQTTPVCNAGQCELIVLQ